MLILTTNVLDVDPAFSAFDYWHGPRILINLPGSGLTRDRIERLSEDLIVIDYLQPPANAANMLCDVAEWLRLVLEQAEWPLLFLDRPIRGELFVAHAEECWKAFQGLEVELSDEGRLVLLRLGEMIVTSPLLTEFFNFIRDRSVDDATFVDLLNVTFA